MLLHREMRAPLIEEEVLAHEIGVGQRLVDVAELEADRLVQVPLGAVVVDPRLSDR